MTFVIWTALNLLTCPDTRWVHCAFAAENAFTCRSCRGRQRALCSLASLPLWLSLRLSLYSPHLPSDTVQQAKKKKSRIKLFRSAGTNFLLRPLALKLRIRTDPETESDILGKEQQGGPGLTAQPCTRLKGFSTTGEWILWAGRGGTEREKGAECFGRWERSRVSSRLLRAFLSARLFVSVKPPHSGRRCPSSSPPPLRVFARLVIA